MDTLLNDIFHAQPYALLIIAGLVFITIAIVGSIKTYIDPGKAGRIAAGAAGAVLLCAGLFMSKSAPATASAPPAVPKVEAATHGGESSAPAAGTLGKPTTACYVQGHWPTDIHKQMAAGDTCTLPDGLAGKAVLANNVCNYTSGPLNGTSAQFNNLMYVGYSCTSPDKQSKGQVPAPVATQN
ncbi:hypothetical protein [Granulicella tundricola]|uniref:Uncharacterized protein n=1 Tax=Granulicella tundricola (strain ATCC BAA-1859 / DSM 23138 / MP5ACTX9) TaxID=1198114 RepID=E8X402_GRATM|nr:hypothetical protein [Granulicella tundricola]ADW70510.1 hypothetical protein AciX9_3505 [Granulicella tundricola MP5ACTX9]